MKILLVTPLSSPEIPEPVQYVNKIVDSLKTKNEIHVISYGNKKTQTKKEAFTIIPKNKIVPVRMFLFFLAVLKKAKHYDVIFIQDTIAVGLPSILAAKISGTKTVIRLIEDEPWKRATQLGITKLSLSAFSQKPIKNYFIKLTHLVQKFVLAQSDEVIVSSHYIKDIISQTYKLNKTKVHILYTLMPTPPRLPFTSQTIPYHITLYTNLKSENSLKKILYSLEQLHIKFPSIHLHILDANIIEVANTKIEIQNIDHTIHRYTSNAEFWHIIAQSALCIYDIHDMSDYNHLLSILLLKTPIITFNSKVAEELFKNNTTYPFTNISNENSLTNTINTVISNEINTDKETLGISELIKKFSLLTHVSQLESILKNNKTKR